MAIFSSYYDAPSFAAGCDSSATAIGRIWKNARLVDMISLIGRDGFQAHNDNPERTGDNPLPLWQGGFMHRTGMTSATLVFFNTLSGLAERIRVYFNGAQVADVAATAGDQTFTIALAGLGLLDRQLVDVEIKVWSATYPEGDVTGGSAWGRYQLIDAYASPISAAMTAAWPGVPTFTNQYDHAKLNQLANASDFLALRLGLVPFPLLQSIVHATGEYWAGSNKGLFYGGIARSGPFNVLRLNTAYQIPSNVDELLRVKINGTVVATKGPLATGAVGGHEYLIDLSGYAEGQALRVQWESKIDQDPVGAAPQPSRYSLYGFNLVPGAGLSFAGMPAETQHLESISWATFKGRLNLLAGIFNAVKARIDAYPDLYDRARFFRSGYGYDYGQREYFQFRHIPLKANRVGAVLAVRGKGITINWGPATITAPKEQGGEYSYKYAFSETLTPGDQVQSKLIYLDSLPGLEVGAAYNLGGVDIRYAAEFLR